MKIYKATEKEIDDRLLLAKQHDIRGFCRNFDSKDEMPTGFYKSQDKLRNGLEKVFWENFDDKADRSKLPSWQTPMNEFFFFDAEDIASERMVIEMSFEILGDKLIGLIMSYLEKYASGYCVIGAVHTEEKNGAKYIGRFVINLDEIAIEESLADTWSKQVKFMEIENL
jgi:hypothetical protein